MTYTRFVRGSVPPPGSTVAAVVRRGRATPGRWPRVLDRQTADRAVVSGQLRPGPVIGHLVAVDDRLGSLTGARIGRVRADR